MRYKICMFLFLLLVCTSIYGAEGESLNICNSNILYDKTNGTERETWAFRRDITLDFYNTHKFDIIAMQEVSQTQLADFKQWSDYGYVGQGVRGDSSGIANMIFYNTNRIKLLDSGTFWLSPTPTQISKGWDAAQFRNCTWAKLEDRKTNKVFYYFVTHFDHLGKAARLESAKLMLDTIPVIAKGYPAILSGDLNAIESDAPIVALKSKFIDPRIVTMTSPKGPYGTGHGLRINVNVRRIDYFFLCKGTGRDRFETEEYEVIDKTFDGKCMSDHWSVRIKVRVTDAPERTEMLLQKLHNPDVNYIFVTAHRGDWRNAPENSLPAIQNAIRMGVDIIELDVQRTKDGQFILMHDPTLDRTTTGKGKVSDWTLDSIRTLRLKNGCAIKTKEKVPTLEEALLLMKDRVLVNLDKADRYFDEVFTLLEKTETTGQVIMKGSKPPKEVKTQFGRYLDEVIYMPIVNLDKENAEGQMQTFLTELKPVAFELLFVNDSNTLPKQIKMQLDGKALIWYNTLWDTMAGGHDDDMSLENPDAGYGYLIDTLGAKIIQTDRPGYLLEYLKKRNLHN